MMYLPETSGEPDLVKLFVEMFGLVMPERVAEEVVKKYVRMTFDPDTKELIQVVMPFMTKTEVMTLTVDKVGSPRRRSKTSKCFQAFIGRCSACRAANG